MEQVGALKCGLLPELLFLLYSFDIQQYKWHLIIL